MAPNNTSKSTELIDLNLEERRPVFKKCHSKEETSLRHEKMEANEIGCSKSQTNVKGDEHRGWDAPERNKSVFSLVNELLCDIYSKMEVKRRISATTCDLSWQDSDQSRCCSNEVRSSQYWKSKDVNFLEVEKYRLEKLIAEEGSKLVKYLKRKNHLLMKREAHCDVITAYIQAVSTKTREDTKMKFSLTPGAETGFSQWLDAMKMVAQLPGGMPAEFRTKLWLQLSEKHLNDQNVDWEKAEAVIFNEWTNPDDEELGVQIVKDLHRTGCSLFCGEQEHNQALLKRVLLAYARWNKNVGYCQGFNMLAALILQVMDKDEKNAVKVMIYLIEGVLPESYFANNLRGLSVDMAVFRDLLRLRLPKLSKHLEALQHDTNAGTSYEPPLTNVFTMQWFLTLFSNCLPQQTVLRVWDLVFLYGNEVLLRTALAIWGILQDRVITVESADEFYSIMGVVTREMLEFGLMDANALVKTIAMVDPFPNELQELREKYLYNISPWTQSVQSAAKKGIRLFYSDPDDQDDTEDEDKIALATAYGVFRRRESTGRELQLSGPTLDISVLKQQYAKLRQRQRQAHVIITAACSSNFPGSLASGPSVSVNHLLMGKSALVNKGRRIGPPEGSIPPPNYKTGDKKETRNPKIVVSGQTIDWKDAEKKKIALSLENTNKSNKREKVMHENEKNRIKLEDEENKLKTNHDRMKERVTEKSVEDSLRTKEAGGESSGSSTNTELCDDEFHRISDFDSEDNSDASSYRLRGTSPKPVRSSPDPPDFFSRLSGKSPEVKFSENGGCEKDNYQEIKNFAIKLVNEIEEKIQSSVKLSKLRDEDERGEAPKDLPPEVEKFDNTPQVVSLIDADIQFLNDNILKPEPEVPIRENVIKTGGEEDSKSEDEAPTEKRKGTRRKSDLGLNVIRENLEILHKFSLKSSNKTTSKSFEMENNPERPRMDCKKQEWKTENNPETAENNPETAENNPETTENNPETAENNPETAENNPETTENNPETAENNPETAENKLFESSQTNEEDEGKKKKTNYYLIFEQEVQKSPKTEAEAPRPLAQNFLVEKAISPITEKTSKSVKVNKEVNTEITFGVDEVEISTSRPKFRIEDEPKPVRTERFRKEEDSPIPETLRRSRESYFRDKDEIKQRLETSKSDWELKMKRIAELETTTRETLNEIRARSVHRKSLHRSLDRNTRRSYIEDDRKLDGELSPTERSFLPKIKLDDEESSQHRKLKISALSFDAITSRTEKLLGKVEFNRSTDETYYKRSLSPEFKSWKPKDSTSKFKKLIEESYGGDLDLEKKSKTFGSKSYEFYSSPTSPEYRARSSVKHSDCFSPKKYSLDVDEWKKSKHDDEDFVKITQNESKTFVDLVKRKYSPERKKPEVEFESHSSKSNFNPFPKRSQSRPKELGVKLGLYPTSPEGQSKKS